MKKSVLSIAMGAALFIAPMTASALSPMTADSLKDATGQAGVSIALDNIVLYQKVGATTYTDTDGYYDMDAKAGMGGLAEDKAASIVIGSKESLKKINAILDSTSRGGKLSRAYGEAEELANGTAFGDAGIKKGDIRPLNIDVAARTQVLSAGMMYNASGIDVADQTATLIENSRTAVADAVTAAYTAYATGGGTLSLDEWKVATTTLGGATVTNLQATLYPLSNDELASVYYDKTQVAGVVIGLPTVEIQTTSDSYDIGIAATGAHNDGKKFIKITKGASVMAILGGTVEIAAH